MPAVWRSSRCRKPEREQPFNLFGLKWNNRFKGCIKMCSAGSATIKDRNPLLGSLGKLVKTKMWNHKTQPHKTTTDSLYAASAESWCLLTDVY